MNRKFKCLAFWSFVLALGIYIFSFVLYHYLSPVGGLSTVFQPEPAKPFITACFAVWGVMFHFAGIMSLLIARIFYPKEKNSKGQGQ